MAVLFLILIVLSGLFALIQVFRIKDTFARVINGVFAVAIGVSFIPVPQVAIDGYYLFVIACLLVVLYPFQDSSFSQQKRLFIASMGGIQMIATVFFVAQWPYVDFVFAVGLITVFIYIFLVSRDIQTYKEEIGFLTVLMVDGLIKSLLIISQGA